MRPLLFLLGFLALSATAHADITKPATEFISGVHYKTLPQQQPTESQDKIELIEAFSYMCPHCFRFQPYLHDWLAQHDDVELIRLPVALGHLKWLNTAKAFYVAEALGKLDATHMATFETIHKKRVDLSILEQQIDFFADYGIDKETYLKALESFAIDTKIRRSTTLARNYQITGTPTIIINGKYVTSALMAGSMENAIKVIDMLVKLERDQES